MLGYVVEGKVIPHSQLANNAYPTIETYFSDGSDKSRLALMKLAAKRKKRKDTKGIVITPPKYKVTFLSRPSPKSSADIVGTVSYLWDFITVSDLLEKEVYSSLDFYIRSLKDPDAPRVKLEGKSLSTYMILVEMLFDHMKVFEEKTGLPIVILERLLRYTVYLSPENNDWDHLAELAGFEKVTHEPGPDVIQITCGGSLYAVKRGLLKFFARQVAPIITKMLYRSTTIYVGETEVSLGTLYYIKKRLDTCVKLEYPGKDAALTEEDLRDLHRTLGLNLLRQHGKKLAE